MAVVASDKTISPAKKKMTARARFMKVATKRHHGLLFYIFLLVAGSALWLKFALKGDKSGNPVYMPEYLRLFRGKKIVEDIDLQLDL